jgi:hypothetical protein
MARSRWEFVAAGDPAPEAITTMTSNQEVCDAVEGPKREFKR